MIHQITNSKSIHQIARELYVIKLNNDTSDKHEESILKILNRLYRCTIGSQGEKNLNYYKITETNSCDNFLRNDY